MRIFIFCFTTLLLCSISTFASDSEQSLSAGASYGMARFAAESPYSADRQANIWVDYRFHSLTSLNISATHFAAAQPVETPQGTNSISTLFDVFAFQLVGNFFSVPLLGDLSLGAGTGFVNIKQESLQISLGALGSTNIPSRRDQHFLYTLSSSLSRSIGPRFAAVVSAKMHFLTLEERQNLYTISGGVNVRLW